MKRNIIMSLVGAIMVDVAIMIIAFTWSYKSADGEGAQIFFEIMRGIIAGFFAISGFAVIIVGLMEGADSSRLKSEGKYGEGEIADIKEMDGTHFCLIRFTDEFGTPQTFEDCYFSGYHQVGDKVGIKYTRKKNGKIVGRLLDRG